MKLEVKVVVTEEDGKSVEQRLNIDLPLGGNPRWVVADVFFERTKKMMRDLLYPPAELPG